MLTKPGKNICKNSLRTHDVSIDRLVMFYAELEYRMEIVAVFS